MAGPPYLPFSQQSLSFGRNTFTNAYTQGYIQGYPSVTSLPGLHSSKRTRYGLGDAMLEFKLAAEASTRIVAKVLISVHACMVLVIRTHALARELLPERSCPADPAMHVA